MAKASVDLVCQKCGKPFTHTHICLNSRERDNYEAWAKENVTLCRDCSREEKLQEKRDQLEATLTQYGYVLPEITGVSDRQIAYAKDLREKHLFAYKNEVRLYCRTIASMRDHRDELEAAAKEQGTTVEEAWKKFTDEYPRTYVAMFCPVAKTIIETLT